MREQRARANQGGKENFVHGVLRNSAGIEALGSIRASVKIVVSEIY
jgi:hypothetical protein